MASQATTTVAAKGHLLLAFSDKDGVRAWRGPPGPVSEVPMSEFNASQAKLMSLSDDGAALALVDAQCVRVLKLSAESGANPTLRCTIAAPAVIRVYFSPLASFVVTFQRPPSDPNVPLPETLVVWDALTGARVHGWALRVPLSWPTLRWSSDELVSAALLHKGSLVFFTGVSFARAVQHLDVPDMKQFSLSPGKEPYHVAVFVPGGQGGAPGSVQVYRYPSLGSAVIKKSFHADSVSVEWNAQGSAFLLQVSVEVDKTNQSYYGRTGLHHVRLAPKLSDARVTDEQVHDVKWAPSGQEFAVIYGQMPDPKISVFDLTCTKRVDLAEHDQPRNTLHYDPSGRILCVGGFASLKGDMDFWDLQSPALRKLGRANAFSSAYHAWSPDGRFFVACVLSPRIRIDNGIKYFDCYGQLLHELALTELYEVKWAPWPSALVAPLRTRAISPRRAVKALAPLASSSSLSQASASSATSSTSSATVTSSSSSSSPATSAAAPKTGGGGGAPGVYRHPNWKGSETSISTPKSAAPTPARYDAQGNTTRTLVGGTPIGGKPIGGTPLGGTPVGGKPIGGNNNNNNSNTKAKAKVKEEAPAAEVSPANKKRNLEKKLRQIEVLKARQAKGDTLNAEQLAKMSSEAQVIEEIAELAKIVGEDGGAD